MDEDAIQHHADLMARVALMVAVVITVAVLVTAAALLDQCDQCGLEADTPILANAPGKPAVTDKPPADSTTPAGGSNETISI